MRFVAFLLVSFPFLVYSQSYRPFPTENASWKEYRYHAYGFGGGEHHIQEVNLRHDMGGDTTVNNLTYKKIFYSARDSVSYGAPNWTGTVTHYNNLYVGAIREDSEKRIYVMLPDETEEMLLYDFNLSIGDTIAANFIDANDYPDTHFTVGAMDSILIVNEYHKVYEIVPPNSQYTSYSNEFEGLLLIEGVGSSLGLFQFKDNVNEEQFVRLECFSMDGVNTPIIGNTCKLNLTVDVSESEFPEVTIGPNPTSELVELSLRTGSSELIVNVYTIDGRLVSSIQEKNTSKVMFPLGRKSGVYLIEVIADGHKVVRKIVKV